MLNKNDLKYQLNYAESHPMLYSKSSRNEKAKRMIILLKLFLDSKQLRKATVLDIGCSTGIIDYKLSKVVKNVICIDIDKNALVYAQKNFNAPNLIFEVGDAMALSYRDNSFDVVVCTHTYEHVPDQQKLMSEIFRVLKKGGICYFAAINRLSIIESHYFLPFLSWLPKKAANYYLRLFGKGKEYYEKPLDYWQLKKLLKNFKIIDYTPKILKNPKKFGYENKILFRKPFAYILRVLSPFLKYFSTTFMWILIKDK